MDNKEIDWTRPMEEILEALESRISNNHILVLSPVDAKQFISWIKSVYFLLLTQKSVINKVEAMISKETGHEVDFNSSVFAPGSRD